MKYQKNKWKEKQFILQLLFVIGIKSNKIPRNYLKYVKNLYTENYKALLTEI